MAALHAAGIRAPIYLSAQCDEFAANAHPEWIAVGDDLRIVKSSDSVFTAGWQIMDMSSPYQGYLVEQLTKVIERFAPLDGIFIDMSWDQPSTSTWAREAMLADGLDPASQEDRDRYAHESAHWYMARGRELPASNCCDWTV